MSTLKGQSQYILIHTVQNYFKKSNTYNCKKDDNIVTVLLFCMPSKSTDNHFVNSVNTCGPDTKEIPFFKTAGKQKG